MKIKTFEETMQQLDEVFTNSVAKVGTNESNSQIATEIRKMQGE